jgi:dihydrofolate reductase
MPNVVVFNSVTLDGYFAGANGDISWAHSAGRDDEWNAFVAGNAGGGGTLLLGRVTYDMMASYWPTPQAARNDPAVAEHINGLRKIVFSTTLGEPKWNNTTVVKSGVAETVRRLKRTPGPDMVVLGSGSIVLQLAQENLVDEYQFVLCPVALGSGKTMFEGLSERVNLVLSSTRAFRNGKVVICYAPSK